MKIIYKVLNHEFERLAVLDLSIEEVNQRIDSGIYGKKERWIRLDQATDFEKSREDDRRVIVDVPEWIEEELDSEGKKTGATIIHEAVTHIEIHVPDDFTVTPEDITEQYEAELELQEEIEKRAAGSKILAYINTVNNSKGYTSEQYFQMYQNPTIQFIKLMLESGALGSAKTTLDSYVVDSLIDQDYKDRVSSFIQKEIEGLNG